MRDLLYVAGRGIGTGLVGAVIWGVPMFFSIDWINALTDTSAQQQSPPRSMIVAPFDTPYTDNAIKYAGGLGLVGGLAFGSRDVRKRKKREKVDLNLIFRHPDRGDRNLYL